MKSLIVMLIGLVSIPCYSQSLEKCIKKGDKFRGKSKCEEAIDWYSKALEKDPTNLGVLAVRGDCYYQIGDVTSCIEDFSTALEFYPAAYKLHAALGSVYTEAGDFENGMKHYTIAQEHGVAFSTEELFGFGTAYFFLQDYENAIPILESIHDQDPSHAGAVNNLGWCHIDSDPAVSCEYFQKAFELDSLSDVNINNLGYSYLLCGSLNDAKNCFDKVLEINPENAFVYRNLALFYKEIDDRTASCTHLQKALDLNIVTTYGRHFVSELLVYCEN